MTDSTRGKRDTTLYSSLEQMRRQLPASLASAQVRVLKRYRGSGGNGGGDRVPNTDPCKRKTGNPGQCASCNGARSLMAMDPVKCAVNIRSWHIFFQPDWVCYYLPPAFRVTAHSSRED